MSDDIEKDDIPLDGPVEIAVPLNERAKDRFAELCDAEGFVHEADDDEDPQRDFTVLGARLWSVVVKPGLAHEMSEREVKATKVPYLVNQVGFPTMAEFLQDDDVLVAREVKKLAQRKVNEIITDKRHGYCQRRAIQNTSWLCHAVLGEDDVPSVYLTDSLECMLTDSNSNWGIKLVRLTRGLGQHLDAQMGVFPDFAAELNKDYRRLMRAALTEGNAKFKAALEAAKDDGNDSDGAGSDAGE